MASTEGLLKTHKLKVTQARSKVLEVYLNSNYALSHSEVEDRIAKSLDRVTLYRTLKSFEDNGILHRVLDESGVVKYSLCSGKCDTHEHADHHLHLYCEKCENTYCLDHVEIPAPTVPNGFQVNDWYMLAKGVCASCA